MRCAVVAVAPPAVPLQRRYRPRSARAVCAAPGSVPATARCRSIAASLCACSASPAGARRCVSAACASATVQRCAQPLRSHRPRHELWSCSRLQRCAAPPHHSPALPSTALHSKWRLRIGLASALARAPYGCFASAVLVARCYRPRVRLRCLRPERRHSRAQAVRMHAFPCAHPRVHGLPDASCRCAGTTAADADGRSGECHEHTVAYYRCEYSQYAVAST